MISYLFYVLPEGKAIRYGVTVGEEALAWSGVAKIGRMTEWPTWTPTPELKKAHRCAELRCFAPKTLMSRWIS